MKVYPKTDQRAKVFELYSQGINQNEIIRHTKLEPDYIDELIRHWEVTKAREKLRLKHMEQPEDPKPRILIERPLESNFILYTTNQKLIDLAHKLNNPKIK